MKLQVEHGQYEEKSRAVMLLPISTPLLGKASESAVDLALRTCKHPGCYFHSSEEGPYAEWWAEGSQVIWEEQYKIAESIGDTWLAELLFYQKVELATDKGGIRCV